MAFNAGGNNYSDADIKQWWGSGKTPDQVIQQAAALGMTPQQVADSLNTAAGTHLGQNDVQNYMGNHPTSGYQFDATSGQMRPQTQVEQTVGQAGQWGQPYVNALNGILQAQGPAPKLDTPAAFNFQADPGYQFTKQQGEDAINAAAAARGDFFGGRVGKELAAFNSGLADTTYGNAYNRYLQGNTDARATNSQQYNQWQNGVNNALGIATQGYNAGMGLESLAYGRGLQADQTNWDRMSQVANAGQGAANATGVASQNYGSGGSQQYGNIGQANAGGAINSANAWTNAGNNALSYYAYMNNPWLNRGTPTTTNNYPG